MSIAIRIEQPSAADIDIIHAFLAETYWSPGVPREVVVRACANSVSAIARDDKGALIGYARVVTDRATFAWLADVFVLGDHQGKGVARQLVRTLQQELPGLRRWLLATKDAHGVYAPLGFEPLTMTERYMHIRPEAPYGRQST